ncbi:DUF222 domain-containing protein [Microbispora bryophytorum]|uniref:DUF222 domain-containing protein n=1 Tax=Microbispora bryophytorum TaxID=1460882 RepID=UPI003400521F
MFDPDHHRRSNSTDGGWWDQLTAHSPLWASDGSLARDDCRPEYFPIGNDQAECTDSAHSACGATDAGAETGSDGSGAPDAATGAARGRSSWVLVSSLRESAQALALAPLPGDADVCLAEAEDLLFARDRITCALADRVGRVHGAGQARQHGHASTRSWLRTAAGMSVAGAGRLLTLAVELARLPRVREKFAAGVLAAGVVEAICTATARLSDEHAVLAEPILLELAGKAGPAEVAKAGRYLRAVLDPDGEERDERADYGRRFLRVRPTAGGGLEGEFYLPREAAARLRALLDAYAKPRAEGDDRPLRVRQADAFIALMEQKIVAELLVLVNAESLPTDPEPDHPEDAENAENAEDTQGADSAEDTKDGEDGENAQDPQGAETTEAALDAEDGRDAQGATSTEDAQGSECAEDGRDAQAAEGAASAEDGRDSEDTGAFGGTGNVDGPCQVEDSDVKDCDPSAAAPAASGNLNDADPGDMGDDVGMTGAAPAQGKGPYRPRDPGTAEAEATVAPAADAGAAADAAADAAAGNTDLDLASAEGDDTAPRRGADRDHAAAQAGTDPERAAARPTCGGSAPSHSAPQHTVPPHAAQWPDPPPEDAAAHHTHAGHQPAGGCRHGQGSPEGHNDVHHEQPAAGTARGPAPGALGAVPGALLGMALGTAPGLLLATGQMLPVSSVHRLARTSALVRLVMDAEGQVLDMGRKVRLATPAQRRAVYARYATCWIDGCPLPATMCQIDHADNWSTGGLTDLKLLGPACQFHNRDRYQHPDRYTRHQTGTDRWAFTYHRKVRARRLRV